MKLGTALENYLKAILILQKKKGRQGIRSVDVAELLNVSKPSVSHAIKVLRQNGYVTMDSQYCLTLTETGYDTATKIYSHYLFFVEQLVKAGIGREVAEKEACRMEHCISEESFQKLKESIKS